MPWRTVARALVLAGAITSPVAAQEIWGGLSLPGGADAARLVLDVGRDGDRPDAVWLLDYIERYTLLRNRQIEDEARGYLRFHSDLAAALARRPAGCVRPPQGASRAAADTERDCLAWFGLHLRERDGAYAIEYEPGGSAAGRREWLAAAGLDPATLAAALNRDEPAPVVLPQTELPLPLPAFWNAAVFSPDEPGIATLVASREAALLYRGLVALDPETLRDLDRRHDLLRRLLRDAPATFAAFSRSLHLAGGRVRPPAGEDAGPVWEALVGRPIDRVDEFVTDLFVRDRGRLAYFYDAVERLDPVRRRFLIGADGDADRIERARRVYDVFRSFDPIWDAAVQPTAVPTFDPGLAVALIGIDGTGTVGPAWWPSLLERVVDSGDWPDRPEDTERRLRDRPADARWYLTWLFERPAEARRRFELLRYLQRRDPAASRADAHDVGLALRAMLEMPALALSLERIGVDDPRVVGGLGRRLHELSASGSRERVVPVLARWQNVIGWIEQASRHRLLTGEQRRALVEDLLAAMPVRAGDADGTAAAWFVEALLPVLVGARGIPSTEPALIDAIFADRERTDAPVTWEGLEYRIERWAPGARAVDAIRAVQAGPRLVDLVRLQEARRAIEVGLSSVDAVAAVRAVLADLAAPTSSAGLDNATFRAATGARTTVLRNLARITRSDDVPRAARELDRLARMADAMTDAVLRPTLYALAASPTAQPAALHADHWTRHVVEAGLPDSAGAPLLLIWNVPRSTRAEGGGVSVSGSWLALDVALADAQLRDVPSDDLLPPAFLNDEDRQAIVGSLTLRRDPVEDAAWAPASVVAAGRARVDAWRASPVAPDEIWQALTHAGADAWRVNLAMWEAARGPDGAIADWLTVSELFWLGGGSALPAAWGVAGPAIDGCLCLAALDPWRQTWFRDRPGSGLAGALVSDLPLRLAEHLDAAGLPMTLMPLVLRGATHDWLSRTWQAMPGDTAPLAVFPRQLPLLRLDDYLLALVADRVLTVPERGVR